MVMVIVKKIIHYLALISYVLIGIYVAVCIPILFKYNPLIVLTGSMEPTFKVGSIIYYKEVDFEELKVGDIITFNTKDNSFVSHRIVSIENGLIETKGDQNNTPDPEKVRFEDVKGKDANLCIPYVGHYVKFINENLTICMIVVVAILVSEFIFSNTELFDKNKKERSDSSGEEK